MELKQRKILVADDEPDILEIISYNLIIQGYEVFTAKDGDEAIEKAKKVHPDLIILDIMMPYKSGVDVCRILRSQAVFENTLIIFLTALNDDATQIKSLGIGGDDFISKPVSPKVLISRVNAMFRRAFKEDGKIIQLGNVTIDPEKYLVTIKGTPILLAKKEFELLYMLASSPGRVFLRNEILNQVWGHEVIVGDRTIDVHVRKIRQKLGLDYIATVKGVGYKFELQNQATS
jgi:two-component system alkaline phosphatase synthesis response regulator PhoP